MNPTQSFRTDRVEKYAMQKEIHLKILELALDKVKDTNGLHLDSLLDQFTQGEIDTNIEYLTDRGLLVIEFPFFDRSGYARITKKGYNELAQEASRSKNF